MFTGLIGDLGEIASLTDIGDGVRLEVTSPLAAELEPGDSVAVNGVCLTATDIEAASFRADVMHETLRRSSLRDVAPGSRVNLELPLRATDRLGGHVVQGHVDGVGTVLGAEDDGFARRVEIEAPEDLMRYVVEKGSVAVDGVSLTIAELRDSSFTVSLIPETLQRTNLAQAHSGCRVNLEVDVLAKYVERLVTRTR
ncbi:MAG: riboflavin synthase [Solirubrobacteraceae bacterium]